MPDPFGYLLYCRPGFEKECIAELRQQIHSAGICGYMKADERSGFLVHCALDAGSMYPAGAPVAFRDLIFARQLIVNPRFVEGLRPTDRITPLIEQARSLNGPFSSVWLETADTNAGKELSAFTRKFAPPFTRALETSGLLTDVVSAPRLHLFFITATAVYLGTSSPGNSAPWPMGIPRLKFPREAPSRSTLKLEEALLLFVRDPQRWLAPGMTAVDLGASPGGWTWQLVRRHLRVTAVDNGGLQQALLDSGLVDHVRADAFRYRPTRPVDWMVCDVVEQPSRIAALVGRWMAEGWCRQSIFNLKLPMKKRFQEVNRCREIIAQTLEKADLPHGLRFKHLYHDREEVTGYVRRIDPR